MCFIVYFFDLSIANTVQNYNYHKETGKTTKSRAKKGRFYPNIRLNGCLGMSKNGRLRQTAIQSKLWNQITLMINIASRSEFQKKKILWVVDNTGPVLVLSLEQDTDYWETADAGGEEAQEDVGCGDQPKGEDIHNCKRSGLWMTGNVEYWPGLQYCGAPAWSGLVSGQYTLYTHTHPGGHGARSVHSPHQHP